MSDSGDSLARDRAAIEFIAGRPLAGGRWPAGALQPGARVRVVKDAAWDGPWRDVFVGTVDDMIDPQPVPHTSARPGELEYSVQFDRPQLDAGGNGPYRKVVIWERYLELL